MVIVVVCCGWLVLDLNILFFPLLLTLPFFKFIYLINFFNFFNFFLLNYLHGEKRFRSCTFCLPWGEAWFHCRADGCSLLKRKRGRSCIGLSIVNCAVCLCVDLCTPFVSHNCQFCMSCAIYFVSHQFQSRLL